MNAGNIGKAGTAHVLIVGGGFAGLKGAMDLAADQEIAIGSEHAGQLIDRRTA